MSANDLGLPFFRFLAIILVIIGIINSPILLFYKFILIGVGLFLISKVEELS
jgi:hypothetical protein